MHVQRAGGIHERVAMTAIIEATQAMRLQALGYRLSLNWANASTRINGGGMPKKKKRSAHVPQTASG